MLEGIAQYVDVNLKMTLAHYNAYAAQTCYARTFGNEREVYWCCGRSVSVILYPPLRLYGCDTQLPEATATF